MSKYDPMAFYCGRPRKNRGTCVADAKILDPPRRHYCFGAPQLPIDKLNLQAGKDLCGRPPRRDQGLVTEI